MLERGAQQARIGPSEQRLDRPLDVGTQLPRIGRDLLAQGDVAGREEDAGVDLNGRGIVLPSQRCRSGAERTAIGI